MRAAAPAADLLHIRCGYPVGRVTGAGFYCPTCGRVVAKMEIRAQSLIPFPDPPSPQLDIFAGGAS